VEQVPYQVCRLVEFQETVRVPHCVEKRIPVTYTCTVPRVVCYREPIAECGQVVSECGVPAAVPASPIPATRPVPAPSVTGADGANVQPSLPVGPHEAQSPAAEPTPAAPRSSPTEPAPPKPEDKMVPVKPSTT
jgi:hypothetical protein